MKQPKSLATKILYQLIEDKKGVSERKFYYNSFRQRLSEIRYLLLSQGVILHSQWVKFKNEFNHPGQYKNHFIIPKDLPKAKEVYEALINKIKI